MLLGAYASKGMWGAVGRTMAQMRQVGVEPDGYTYGPLLEACRRSGQRQRARSFGRTMLLSRRMELSPFCLTSLRKSLGGRQLQQLCDECGVAWKDAEAALAEATSRTPEGGGRGGGRSGGGGPSSSSSKAGAGGGAQQQSEASRSGSKAAGAGEPS